ncbi:DUF2207 domain-containing protein [Peptoniphilus equinus]|uniref:DUF2207 domain-containing protein n=1 Tax=Peptoniphilus equinus TaxID=3016343 RepID=A0ABY7QVY4_9FIRM|nr:DUF2207 domain-containing protein [Peptoniphilus equinus]WBW50430.1 DUF2207 domain-containing protein [Peptoniphilus equinus]
MLTEYKPAAISALAYSNRYYKEMVLATLLDLSLRGHVVVSETDIVRQHSCDSLATFESKLLEILFQNNTTVTFKTLSDAKKAAPDEHHKAFEAFFNALDQSLYDHRLKTQKNSTVLLLSLLGALGVMLGGFILIPKMPVVGMLLIIAGLFAGMTQTVRYFKKPETGEALVRDAIVFKDNFTPSADPVANHLALALGIATDKLTSEPGLNYDVLLEQMKKII